jgi:hypothetical protein
MIERNIAYRMWRRKKTAADRQRYKTLRKQVNYLIREAKRLYMKLYLDPNLSKEILWRNLDFVGAETATENELVFSPDQLNSFFTSTQNSATRNRRIENDEGLNGFAFSNTFDLGTLFIKSNQTQLGCMVCRSSSLSLFSRKYWTVVTHIFNTILATSVHPTAWKTSKIMPIAKKSEPINMLDYRLISVLLTLFRQR